MARSSPGTWFDIVPENRTCVGADTAGLAGMKLSEDVEDPPISVSDMSAQDSTAAGSEKSHSTRSFLGLSRASSLMAGRVSVSDDLTRVLQDVPIADSLLNSSRLRRQKLGKPAESSKIVVDLIVSVRLKSSPSSHCRRMRNEYS